MLNRFLIRILPLVVGMFLLYILRYAILIPINRFALGIALFLSILAGIWLQNPDSFFIKFPRVYFLSLSIIIFLAIRLLWIAFIPTRPESDFYNYNLLAGLFRQGIPVRDQVHWSYLAYAMGYPVTLGGWYALVGQTLLAGKLLNVILGVIALLLVYRLGSLFNESAGRLAALLFVLWPAQAAYSSVLASEHLAIVFFLASAIALLELITHKEGGKKYACLAGIFLALGYAVRSPLIVLVLGGLVAVGLSASTVKQKIVNTSLILVSFLGVFGLYLSAMTLIYQITPLSQGYSTLLTGTNYRSQGGWNEEDGVKFLQHSSLEEANQWALRLSYRRIASDPSGFLHLMIDKIPKTWSDETYGVMWSTAQFKAQSLGSSITTIARQVGQYSQTFHVFLLVWAIGICMMWVIKGNQPREILWIWFILFSVTFLHMVFEAQARYHFWLEPVLIILASLGITTIIKEIVAERDKWLVSIHEVEA